MLYSNSKSAPSRLSGVSSELFAISINRGTRFRKPGFERKYVISSIAPACSQRSANRSSRSPSARIAFVPLTICTCGCNCSFDFVRTEEGTSWVGVLPAVSVAVESDPVRTEVPERLRLGATEVELMAVPSWLVCCLRRCRPLILVIGRKCADLMIALHIRS